MKRTGTLCLGLALVLSAATMSRAQSAQAAAGSDVYHVQFAKAVPGEAAALAKALATPDPQAPMPGHVIVLRHQQGDDWDFCVIEHLGSKATVDGKPAPANPARPFTAWHTDTFVSGPAWDEFARAMGLTGDKGTSVYSVAVWRAAANQREQLAQLLTQADAGAKVPVSRVMLQHLEGGPWTYLAIDRFNSWQDFAASQAASAATSGSGQDGWSEIRKYATYHHDTLADRIAPK